MNDIKKIYNGLTEKEELMMFDEHNFSIDDIDSMKLELEEKGIIEIDLGIYIYNYSNCCCVYLKKTKDGNIAVKTDYDECVDVVDTIEEARDIVYDLDYGRYAEHSRWWVLNNPDDC